MTELRREVRFESGYDCRMFECRFDSEKCAPDMPGYHGVHGLEIRFLLHGEEGAVQFLLATGWLPTAVQTDSFGMSYYGDKTQLPVTPFDLGFHSRKPLYEGQSCQGPCQFLDGQDCYYDGSSLNAHSAMCTLVNGGDEALWAFLEQYYRCTFNDEPFPNVAEYAKPLRNN